MFTRFLEKTRLYNALKNLYRTGNIEQMIDIAAHDDFVDGKLQDYDPDLWHKINDDWNKSGIDTFRNL